MPAGLIPRDAHFSTRGQGGEGLHSWPMQKYRSASAVINRCSPEFNLGSVPTFWPPNSKAYFYEPMPLFQAVGLEREEKSLFQA